MVGRDIFEIFWTLEILSLKPAYLKIALAMEWILVFQQKVKIKSKLS